MFKRLFQRRSNLPALLDGPLTIESVEAIKKWEGLYLDAYLCPANGWTIGYGHTRGVTTGRRITEEDAERRSSEPRVGVQG